MDDSFLLTRLTFLYLVTGAVAFRYKYLGCYIDSDGSGRDIMGKDFSFSSLTLETCVDQCQPSGFAYAGLQMGSRCLCGGSYGRIGSSLYCNYTCDGVYCGGYQSNDVFYSVDNSLASQRGIVYHDGAKSYDDARMVCVANNGDLSVVNTNQLTSKVLAFAANSNASTKPTNVWFGLHRRRFPNSNNYDWANENADAFIDKDFASFWVANDSKANCVSLNVAQSKWESKPCSTTLPFVCDQMTVVIAPTTDAGDTYTLGDDSLENPSASSNRLALYIVMPLFLLCYGGSCVLYCAYKIYRNCCYKKKADMRFEPVPGHPPIEPVKMGPAPGIFKRPLSGGPKKSAVYPMNVENIVKTGPYPKYETSGMGDVKKEMGLMRKPGLVPNANTMEQGFPPPPSYFGGGPQGPNPLQGAVGQPAPGAGGGDGYNNMSISEILKKKMQEKNNRTG